MIPLGQEESVGLEFKAPEALKRPGIIARSVVAMLNAEGGEIWIGLGESGGRAVEVQPIANADSERERLWNHLVDTIEPSPLGEEVALEVVSAESGHILQIQIHPDGERRPYAQLKEGGRHFVVRTGARIRPMTRDEVLGSTSGRGERIVSLSDPFKILQHEREELLGSKNPMFWIRLQPNRELGIDIQSPKLERYLGDPTLSGSRASGWTFANPYVGLRLEQNRRILGDEQWGRTIVERSGAIDHRIQLGRMAHSPGEQGPQEVHPYALLEKTVSLFRLAKAVYLDQELNSDATPVPASTKMKVHVIKHRLSRLVKVNFQLVVGVALISTRGWKLRAYSPRSYSFLFEHHKVKGFEHLQGKLEGDFLLERPLAFESNELISAPDRCAFRVLSRIYEGFGLAEDKIPSEFDRKRGLLIMPE